VFIQSRGDEILPYSAYEKSKKTCIVLDSKSRRCREYVRRSFPRYDVSGVPARSLVVLIKKEEKLKSEKELVFKAAAEYIACVNCLSK